MKEIVTSFVHYFIHPVKSNCYLGLVRQGLDGEWRDKKTLSLTWGEVILLSWILYFFVVIYDFAGITLGSSFFMTDRLPELFKMKQMGSFLVIKKLAGVVFYPLIAFLGLWANRLCMSFMLKLMGYRDNVNESLESLLAVSLSSNFLLLIPAFGLGLQGLYAIILQIIGVRKQLQLSWGESVLVGMASIFLIIGFILLVSLIVVLIGFGLSI